MENLKDSYEILNISPDSSFEEVKQAYKDLVQIWHPDRYAHNRRLQQRAEEEFKNINSAYENIKKNGFYNRNEVSGKKVNNSANTEFKKSEKTNNSQEEFNNSKSAFTKFVLNIFKLSSQEKKDLQERIKTVSDVNSWKNECISSAAWVGGLAGFWGGGVGTALLLYDLKVLQVRASSGGFGIGHILGCEVDYDFDREIILAIWAGEGTLQKRVPEGKVGIKLNNMAVSREAATSMMGTIVSKTLLKVSFKFLAKLSTKVIAKAGVKLGTKLAVKTGGGFIPFAGSIISGGVNILLLKEFLKAAEEYYYAQKDDYAVYFVLNDNEVAAEL